MKNVEDFYPLSPMQQGMLFASLMAPESGVYVEQMSVTLRGDLDVDAFRRAWQTVVDRYAILRTAFTGEGLKEPVQLVLKQVQVPFTVVDWRDLPPAEQEAKLAAYLEAQRHKGFVLSRAPLLRLALMRIADDAHIFVMLHHHILLDGWSVPILLGEVFAFYEAYRQGKTLHLDAPRPFRDYIVWLKKQDMAAAEAYWRRELAGFTAPPPLMVDDLKRTQDGPAYDEIETRLPRDVTVALEALARQHHVTMSTIVQGAWALLLSRYSGEEDVLFGATVSGRPADLPGAETMVGLFINTLPVRVKVDEGQPVAGWLKGLQARSVEMRQYEYSSLLDIQRWSDIRPGQPLFKSILVFENYPIASTVEGQGISLSVEDVRSVEQTELPLNVVAGLADELVLKIAYDGKLFDAATIRRVLGHLSALLTGFASAPDGPLADVPMLTGEERRTLLDAWSGKAADFPLDVPVYEVIARHACEMPDRVALRFEGQSLTYAELNERANRLAHTLKARGVGPETIVGLSVERSPEMIVGMLGIMKAGGAYLPLDPSYPAERLAHMMADTNIRLLLTQATLQSSLPAREVETLCLDTDWPQIEQASSDDPEQVAGPDSLAYVIYTSGSTGLPKGSLLHHRGLANLVHGFIRDFGFAPGERVLQMFSFGFDGSVMEIFPALAGGATLVLAPRETLLSPPDLHALLKRERITMVAMPPALLSVLDADDLPDLRIVTSGGEALLPEVAAKWLPGRRLINAYGPTETTVCSTWHEVTAADIAAGRIPIGRPVPNARHYVLDARRRLVPVGVPGELYIGGAGVGRGYLNRPELTAEKFVPSPFSDDPGAKLYRTGDLVRWLPDGTLEFLGRTDSQVKIRGFRIELGEIEAALTAHPAIRQAAVTVREDGPGQKWLAGYVVPEAGQEAPTAADLRAFLKERLPDYMIPAAFVTLEALPLNPSGKMDRKALPAPDGARPNLGREYMPPRDILETRLVQLWEEILGVQPVGVKDNFFELGGHSLLAVRLIAQLQKQLEVDLPLVHLFQEPTVEQLASLIRQQKHLSSVLVPLQPKGEKPPLFLVHPTGGSVHWYTDLARCLAPEQPLYGLQAQGLLGDRPLLTTIEEMAVQYVEALREVQPHGPYRLGSYSGGVPIALEMAQQLQASGEQIAFLLMLDQGPHMPLAEPEDQAAFLAETFAKHIPVTVDELRAMGEEQQLEHVWKTAREIGFVYPDVSLEQFAHFVRTMRTHNDAWRKYTPKPYAGHITLFRAMEESDHSAPQPDMGWGEIAKEGVSVYDVPGNHLTMLHEPHVEAVARQLKACLEAASQKAAPSPVEGA
ncbi:MAG: amino acid adenylation domain-containing protein [Chloroflexi bacterium]|nr:amino acid adenylation domain-containing protein [Chloroflexota bacterium]